MYQRELKAFNQLFFELKRLFAHPADRAGLEHLGREQPYLQPFIEYLSRKVELFQDKSIPAEDCDYELYYEVQRTLLISTSFERNGPLAVNFLQFLRKAYLRVATVLCENNQFEKMHLQWRDLIVNGDWAIESGIFTQILYEHILHVPRSKSYAQVQPNPIQIMPAEDPNRVLQFLYQDLKKYVDKKDTWYSKRSNELLSLAVHLLDVIDKYNQGTIWVEKIYTKQLITADIILTDIELTCFYVAYQIHSFLQRPLSKKREITLDKAFSNYTEQLTLLNQRLVPAVSPNKYNLFLLGLLYPRKISWFLARYFYPALYKQQKESIVGHSSLAATLIKFARISGYQFTERMKGEIHKLAETEIEKVYFKLAPALQPSSPRYKKEFEILLSQKVFAEKYRSDSDREFYVILHSYYALLVFYFNQQFIAEKKPIHELFLACYFYIIDQAEYDHINNNTAFALTALQDWQNKAFAEAAQAVSLYLNIMHTKQQRRLFYFENLNKLDRLVPKIREKLEQQIKELCSEYLDCSKPLNILRDHLLPALWDKVPPEFYVTTALLDGESEA
jgi:hypothetical protein